MEDEIWRAIPGFEGYEVSNLGNVRSYHRRGTFKLFNTPHLLKPASGKNGKNKYLGVNLGKANFKRVHHLVALAFIGPRPDGLELCHKDDNKENNRADNLHYKTHIENMREGIVNNGNRHWNTKDTVKQPPRVWSSRDDLIEAYKTSDTVQEVSQKLGIKAKTVMESASRLRRLGIDVPRFIGRGDMKNKEPVGSRLKNLQVLLALEAGEITEAQASEVIGVYRLELRGLRSQAIAAGIKQVVTFEPIEATPSLQSTGIL